MKDKKIYKANNIDRNNGVNSIPGKLRCMKEMTKIAIRTQIFLNLFFNEFEFV